jgi:hypothetical protein
MPACFETLIVVAGEVESGAVFMEDNVLVSVVVGGDDTSSAEAAEVSGMGEDVTHKVEVMDVVIVGRSKVDEGSCADEAVVKAILLGMVLVGRVSGMPGGAASVDEGSENASATLEGCSKADSAELVPAGKAMLVVATMSSTIAVVESKDIAGAIDGTVDEGATSSAIWSPCCDSPCLVSPSSPPPNLSGRLPES